MVAIKLLLNSQDLHPDSCKTGFDLWGCEASGVSQITGRHLKQVATAADPSEQM
jgi:hypothetical protein